MTTSADKSIPTQDVPQDAPADTPVAQVAAKALRSGGVATFAQLRGKPRRTSSFPITLPGEDGEDFEATVRYQALTSKAYDDLVASCPPNPKERQLGAAYDADRFAPKLIAACSLEPKMSEEEAAELYFSPDWSGGEISTLFMQALKVCNAGLDVPFTVRG